MYNILMLNVTSQTGGGPILCDLLTKQLDRNIFKIYYVATDNGPYFLKIQKNVEQIFDINLRTISLRKLFMLVNICKDNKIDIIHSHGRGAGVYSRIIGLLLRKKVIHTFHGIHYDKYKNVIVKKLMMAIENLLSRFSYNIFVSKGEQKTAETLKLTNFIRHSRVILNGIDLKRFKSQKKSSKGKNIQIITLSQISYHKGLDVLVDSVKYLVESGITNFNLIVAGDCIKENIAFKNGLLSIIEENYLEKYINFIGTVENPEELLIMSDIYLSASRGEGLPLSIIEAMASGTLVVASDVVGNNDIIKNAENGYLLKIIDFKSKLKILLENYREKENEIAKLTLKASQDVKVYDMFRMVNEYHQLYKEIINY